MSNPKGIMVKSADTLIIENRLRSAKPGDVVTYDELSTLLGRDVREHCLGNVQTARKALVAESVFFDTVANEGYLCITQEEACSVSQHYVARAKSASRRGLVHLQHVKFDELSDDSKRKHLTTSAQLGAIHLFGSGKAAKKISASVDASTSKALPIGETLKLFGG